MDGYVSTAEAAELLKLSGPAIARRVRRGLLTSHIDPTDLRRRLIAVSDIEALRQPRPIGPAGLARLEQPRAAIAPDRR